MVRCGGESVLRPVRVLLPWVEDHGWHIVREPQRSNVIDGLEAPAPCTPPTHSMFVFTREMPALFMLQAEPVQRIGVAESAWDLARASS